MLLSRYGRAALALSCAGALFAVGFALGSDGNGERPSPKRTSAPDRATPAIEPLRKARSIPSLREAKSRDGASPPANPDAGASPSGGGSAAGSGAQAPSGRAAGSATGSPVGGTTRPSPSEPAPVRRRSTE